MAFLPNPVVPNSLHVGWAQSFSPEESMPLACTLQTSIHGDWVPAPAWASLNGSEEGTIDSRTDSVSVVEEWTDNLHERASYVNCQTPLGPCFVAQPVEMEDAETDEIMERLR